MRVLIFYTGFEVTVMKLDGNACASLCACGLADAGHVITVVNDGITALEDRARISGVEGGSAGGESFTPTGNRRRLQADEAGVVIIHALSEVTNVVSRCNMS